MQATPLDPSTASAGGSAAGVRRILLGNMWVPLGPEPVRDPRDFVITPSIDARIRYASPPQNTQQFKSLIEYERFFTFVFKT